MQPLEGRDKTKSPFTNITTSSSERVLSLSIAFLLARKNDLFADVEFYCFCCIISTRTINRCCVRYRRYYGGGFSSVWQRDRVHPDNNQDERMSCLQHCFLRKFLASNLDWWTARYVLWRHSSVGMMIGLRTGRNGVRFPAGTTDTSLRKPNQSPIQCITGVVSSERGNG
jgi:hypothetical protein